MAVDLQFDLRMPDGSDAVSAMSRIIEKRTKELGETTAQSCTALAINIMKGIRASTKTANMKADITVTDVSGTYYPSWRRNKGAKGKKVSERVLRSGKDGAVIQKDKVMWLCGPYKKGEVLHTYEVVDKVAEGKEYKWLAVAESDRVARRHAEKFHKARVKRARGLAKYALGLAMHKVHSAQSVGGNVSNEARQIGLQCVNATVNDSGFANGEVNIHVEDNLNYASLALEGGEGQVQLAIQRALNGMTAYINKRLEQKGIEDSLKIPFNTEGN